MEPSHERPGRRILTRPVVIAGLCVAATAAAAACSSLKVTNTRTGSPLVAVSLDVAGTSASGSVGGAASSEPAPRPTIVTTVGDSTLSITSVRVVLREIEMRRSSASAACTETPTGQTSDSDQCDELVVRPQLVDLPLQSTDPVPRIAFGNVKVDESYAELWFRLHELSAADSADEALLQQNPGLKDGAAVQISGSWNDTTFTADLPLGQTESLPFRSAIQLGDGAQLGIGVTVDLRSWFEDPDTGRLIDPRKAASVDSVRAKVLANIPASFTMSTQQF